MTLHEVLTQQAGLSAKESRRIIRAINAASGPDRPRSQMMMIRQGKADWQIIRMIRARVDEEEDAQRFFTIKNITT